MSAITADKGWQRAFGQPIPLPNGSVLTTVADVGHYVARPPKREHDTPEWRAAIEALLLVVEGVHLRTTALWGVRHPSDCWRIHLDC